MSGRNYKSKIVAALLALFFGHWGVQWFYLNEQQKGTLCLLTWLGGVGGLFFAFLLTAAANAGGFVHNTGAMVFVLILSVGGIGCLGYVALCAFLDFFGFLIMRDEDFDMQYNT